MEFYCVKFETAFLKIVFHLSEVFWSYCSNSLSPASCIFKPRPPLFEKKRLNCFSKKVCYLSQMMHLDYWKHFSFFFIQPTTKVFAFWRLLMSFLRDFYSAFFAGRISSLSLAVCKDLETYETWFALNTFLFKEACFFKTCKNLSSNLAQLSIFSIVTRFFFFNSLLNIKESNFAESL